MTDDILLTLSLLLMGALLARFVASLLGIPEILVLVVVGALFGSSALDVVDVPFDSLGAQLIFTLGISLILFYGGLSLSLPILRGVWMSLLMLAVPGVVLTALVVGVTAHFAFDLPWDMAFLVGAVLSPTDPAILIPLFVRSRLKPKLAQTVIAESAFNDPTGAALALTLAGVVLTGSQSVADPASDFLVDLGISTVIGIVAGVVLAAAISSDRSGIWRESAPLAVLSVVTISFFSLDTAGGSGYLGAFLAGLIVGNMEHLGLGEENMPHIDRRAPVRLPSRGPGDPDHLHGARREHPLQRAGRQPAAGARGARDADAGGAPDHRGRVRAAGSTGAAGPATSWRSCAGRARRGSCRPRSWASSPGSGCRTATCSPAWSPWRSC